MPVGAKITVALIIREHKNNIRLLFLSIGHQATKWKNKKTEEKLFHSAYEHSEGSADNQGQLGLDCYIKRGHAEGVQSILPEGRPVLALAPMQDVTDLPFMRLIDSFGGPDYYVTEYFRVYENSPLSKYILRSITENQTGKPVFAQMIGQDVNALVKTTHQLMQHEVAGIDINLGCPAPVVCRKDAGGGLLRKPEKLKEILERLREAVDGSFTVKTRVGYESDEEFDHLLDIFRSVEIDALAIHGRTVKERYQTPVHTDRVKQAVDLMPCPVIANGNIVDVETGRSYHQQTGAAGLMLGRGAIRSPWLFEQLRASFEGREVKQASRRDLHFYIRRLFDEVASEWTDYEERRHVNKMKKYMVYIAQGLDEEFEYKIRRTHTASEFHSICDDFLLSDTLLPALPPEKSKLFSGFSELLK